MKYLKHIDELLKSTYKSASKKLAVGHPGRSKEISKYAEEKGENKKIDRIYPTKFTFQDTNDEPDEYYFITNVNPREIYRTPSSGNINSCNNTYNVIFQSNYSNIKMIQVIFSFYRKSPYIDNELLLKNIILKLFSGTSQTIERSESFFYDKLIYDNYRFDSRELASQFKRFLNEYLLDIEDLEISGNPNLDYSGMPDSEECAEEIKKYPINSLYRSKEEILKQKDYTWVRSIG